MQNKLNKINSQYYVNGLKKQVPKNSMRKIFKLYVNKVLHVCKLYFYIMGK